MKSMAGLMKSHYMRSIYEQNRAEKASETSFRLAQTSRGLDAERS